MFLEDASITTIGSSITLEGIINLIVIGMSICGINGKWSLCLLNIYSYNAPVKPADGTGILSIIDLVKLKAAIARISSDMAMVLQREFYFLLTNINYTVTFTPVFTIYHA